MKNSITERPICTTDEPFLFQLFCSARKDQFASLDLPLEQQEQLMQMQCQAQQQQYRGQFPNALGKIQITRRLLDFLDGTLDQSRNQLSGVLAIKLARVDGRSVLAALRSTGAA